MRVESPRPLAATRPLAVTRILPSFLLLLLLLPSVRAGTGAHAALEMGELNTEAALLKARIEVAKLRAALAQARGACAGAPSAVAGGSVVSAPPIVVLPSVVSIGGMGGRVRAKVVYPDGTIQYVSRGSVLEGGERVLSVTVAGVRVETSSGVRTLGFAHRGPGGGFVPGAALLAPPPAYQAMPPSADSASLAPGGG